MRRDYFTLSKQGTEADDPATPTLVVGYEGPTEELAERLHDDGTPLEEDGLDVAYRLQEPLDIDDPSGVLAVADRVTGEYVLEVNADAGLVSELVESARDADDPEDGHFRIVIENEDGAQLDAHEASTLLVYDADGNLLREESLIPSGVEL